MGPGGLAKVGEDSGDDAVKKLILGIAVLFFLPFAAMADEAGPPDVEMKNPKWLGAMLATGGQPSQTDLHAFRDAGYTTVINLRLPGERTKVADPAMEENFNFDEAALTRSLGMKYFSLPIAGTDGLSRENAEKLAELLEKAEGPVLLHCASGNRAGSLLALIAFYVDNKPADEAMAIGLTAGMTGYASFVEKLLEEKPAD